MQNVRVVIAGDKSMAEIPEDLDKAFKELGYNSSFYHFHYRRFAHKIAWGFINTPFRFSKKIGDFIMHFIVVDSNKKFVKHILSIKPDLVIVINGFSLLRSSLIELRENKIKIFNWVVDDPSRARFSSFTESSMFYDILFCCSKSWLDYIKIYNKNIIYLPLAVNTKKYKKEKIINDFKYDICFVGTFTDNDSSSYFRFYLLNFLSKFNYKIRVAGTNVLEYFKGKCNSFILSDKQSLPDVINIYQNSKIVFNPFNIYNQDVISLRIFETGSMNIFQIVPFQKELFELFGDKIVSFKNLDELSEKASYYLKNDFERCKKAQELNSIILEKHTYTDRVKLIIQNFKS